MAHARHKNRYRPPRGKHRNMATSGNYISASVAPERPIGVPKEATWNPDKGMWDVKIPSSPPNEIYKFRLNRANPAEDRWGRQENNEGTNTYITKDIEYRPNEGIFVYYYGLPFPSRGIRIIESIQACLPPKRALINKVRFWTFFRPWYIIYIGGWVKLIQKSLELFNDTADLTLMPYYLKDEYYSGVVRQVRKGIETFLVEIGVNEAIAIKTAEIIGLLFEYDNAYLYRLHDILAEAKRETLLSNFASEVSRLVVLEGERDPIGKEPGADVITKFKNVSFFLKLAWYVPRFRRGIKKAVNSMDFNEFKLTEADIYHTLNYKDYDTRGIRFEDRLKALEAWNIQLFGEEKEGNWPSMIRISTKG